MSVENVVFEDYWRAVARGDSMRAIEIALGERAAGTATLDILESLVCAAQAQVGALWAADEWNVAQEHRATSVGEDVVGALAAELQEPPYASHVVITCADGEWHALPSRVLSTALRAAGHRVTYLGASVPATHLTQLMHDAGPDVVAISCALPTRLIEARRMIETSRGAGVPVIVGGRGFGPDGRWARTLGANRWAPDARAAIALLSDGTLPPFAGPVPPMPVTDDAAIALHKRAHRIVDDVVDMMRKGLADVAAYDERQLRRAAEDVEYIVDFLRAALFVDDAELFLEFVGWLREILTARGIPATTLAAGLRLVGEVITAEPGPYARALHFLDLGVAAVEPDPARDARAGLVRENRR